MIIPFDEREGVMYHNGEFILWKEAKIHILTHALHYGSSCFEGVRIYNGKIFKNKEHAERLLFSASEMDMKPNITTEQIMEICIEVCKRNNVLNGYIRPIMWRGSEQMQVSAKEAKIHFAVAAWNWQELTLQKKKQGLNLIVAKYKRGSAETGPVFAKAGGLYVSSTLCKHDAENQGFEDCLMLDFRGFIAESSTSNVFFVQNEELHTPIADCFLNGVTRKTIIALAAKLGYKVTERHITLPELATMQDAFTVGTASEISKILSVTARDLKTKYEFKESVVSSHLMEEYRKLVTE